MTLLPRYLLLCSLLTQTTTTTTTQLSEFVHVDGIQHELLFPSLSHVPLVVRSFCDRKALTSSDCHILHRRAASRYDESDARIVLQHAPLHLSVQPVTDSNTLRVVVNVHVDDDDSDNDQARWIVKVRINDEDEWLRTVVVDRTASFDLRTRMSAGVVGGTSLDVELGLESPPTILWLPFTRIRRLFTLVPQSLPPPPPSAQEMIETSSSTSSSTSLETPVLSVAFVTSFGDVPNGQINVLVDVAVGLTQIHNFSIRFVTTSPVNQTHPEVVFLTKHGIDVIHAPITVDQTLHSEHRGSTEAIVERLIEATSSATAALEHLPKTFTFETFADVGEDAR